MFFAPQLFHKHGKRRGQVFVNLLHSLSTIFYFICSSNTFSGYCPFLELESLLLYNCKIGDVVRDRVDRVLGGKEPTREVLGSVVVQTVTDFL